MDVEKLKQKILDLAIRGKLVPQDPNDEPASVLIEKIRAEKEKLVKEGKIKAFKEESYIYKGSDNFYYEKKGTKVVNIQKEIPFEIPENWRWIRLNDIGSFKKGPFGSSLTKEMFVPTGYKVYEQKNAIQKDSTLGHYFITKEKFEEMKGFVVNPGDIIVSCAGTIGEIFVLPENSEIGIINQALMRIKLFDREIENYFIVYFDSVLKREANEKGNGTGMKNIPPFDILKQMLLPLPPAKEMKAIEFTLSKIEAIIQRINLNFMTIQMDSDVLKYKILESVFGANSSYKSYYRLNDIFEFQNGYAFSSDTYSQVGTPVVRISDLTDGVVSLDSCVKTNQINIDEKFVVRGGDLLIAMSGATTGKMGVFIGKEKCYLNQRVGNIKIKRKDLIIDSYRNYLFMYLKKDILKAAYGGAQPNISGQKILSMNIYLPSLEIQKQQVDLINAAFKYLDSIIY